MRGRGVEASWMGLELGRFSDSGDGGSDKWDCPTCII